MAKRQIAIALQRAKNQFPGLAANYSERVLLETSMPDDSENLYTGPGTSQQAVSLAPKASRSFWRIAMVEDVAVFAGTNQVTLNAVLPAGAVPLSAHLNFDTALVFASSATKIGFGRASAISELALSSSGTVAKNTKTDNDLVTLTESFAAAIPLLVTSTNDAGASTGTVTGTVRCRVIYRYAASIPDAA